LLLFYLDGIVERLEIPVADGGRVDLALQQRARKVEVLSSKHDDRSGAVSDLFILKWDSGNTFRKGTKETQSALVRNPKK